MGALKNLFSAPKMPESPAPARMPDPSDPAILEARRKKLADMQKRGGRADTVLSDALMGSAGKIGA